MNEIFSLLFVIILNQIWIIKYEQSLFLILKYIIKKYMIFWMKGNFDWLFFYCLLFVGSVQIV
jgi:hypothetical protein